MVELQMRGWLSEVLRSTEEAAFQYRNFAKLQRQKKLFIEIGNLLEGPLFYSKA